MSCRLRPFTYDEAVSYAGRANVRFPGRWGQRWCREHSAYHVRLRFPKLFLGYPVVKHEERDGCTFETIDHLNGSHCISHCPCGGQGGIVIAAFVRRPVNGTVNSGSPDVKPESKK